MISIKKTLRMVPEFILPQASSLPPARSINQGWDVPVGDRVREFYFFLPLIYVRATVCVITLLLAIGVGAMVPWLAEVLERVTTTIAWVLMG